MMSMGSRLLSRGVPKMRTIVGFGFVGATAYGGYCLNERRNRFIAQVQNKKKHLEDIMTRTQDAKPGLKTVIAVAQGSPQAFEDSRQRIIDEMAELIRSSDENNEHWEKVIGEREEMLEEVSDSMDLTKSNELERLLKRDREELTKSSNEYKTKRKELCERLMKLRATEAAEELLMIEILQAEEEPDSSPRKEVIKDVKQFVQSKSFQELKEATPSLGQLVQQQLQATVYVLNFIEKSPGVLKTLVGEMQAMAELLTTLQNGQKNLSGVLKILREEDHDFGWTLRLVMELFELKTQTDSLYSQLRKAKECHS